MIPALWSLYKPKKEENEGKLAYYKVPSIAKSSNPTIIRTFLGCRRTLPI
jgi:hypothetical protein